MKKYRVYLGFHVCNYYIVEAQNEKSALEAAMEMYEQGEEGLGDDEWHRAAEHDEVREE